MTAKKKQPTVTELKHAIRGVSDIIDQMVPKEVAGKSLAKMRLLDVIAHVERALREQEEK